MDADHDDARSPTLQAAVALFDRGSYLASHELFEELWEASEGQDADFFKGLIQAAIAMHHLEQENLDGAARLYRGHRRLLASYLPAHLGIDIRAFLESMERCVRPRLAGGASSERPRIGSPQS